MRAQALPKAAEQPKGWSVSQRCAKASAPMAPPATHAGHRAVEKIGESVSQEKSDKVMFAPSRAIADMTEL